MTDRSAKICAIVNPRAGGWRRLSASEVGNSPQDAVLRWLTEPGGYTREQVSVYVLSGAGQGAELARAAIQSGCQIIVAVGGDGTINDVLQGMQLEGGVNGEIGKTGMTATLGLIPMGTANVLARILGLPLHDPAHAARILGAGNTRLIDIGQAGTRWFALVAGIGFDGAATQAVNVKWKRRIGELAYVLAALRLAMRYPRQEIEIVCDGGPAQTFDAYLVLVANGGQYGGGFRLGPSPRLDDGLLDVYVCERRGPLPWSVLRHGIALLNDRFEGAAGVHHLRVLTVRISANAALPVQIDGDSAGDTPLFIEIAPAALRVLVP